MIFGRIVTHCLLTTVDCSVDSLEEMIHGLPKRSLVQHELRWDLFHLHELFELEKNLEQVDIVFSPALIESTLGCYLSPTVGQ